MLSNGLQAILYSWFHISANGFKPDLSGSYNQKEECSRIDNTVVKLPNEEANLNKRRAQNNIDHVCSGNMSAANIQQLLCQ